MTVAEYLSSVKERLLTDAQVSRFSIVRERETTTDGYLRVRAVLSDESELEFAEYVQHSPDDTIQVVTYSYHWADSQGNLICRWDNTPHFPNLPNAPHHLHDGAEDKVISGQPMSIFAVLDEIARRQG
mgnify:CR=1 FL=1